MNVNVLNKLRQRKRRILKRIENRPGPEAERPMIAANNIQYELADRVQGLAAGGIGAMLLVARKTGLIGDIDDRLHLLGARIRRPALITEVRTSLTGLDAHLQPGKAGALPGSS